jgi:hypothetical protein
VVEFRRLIRALFSKVVGQLKSTTKYWAEWAGRQISVEMSRSASCQMFTAIADPASCLAPTSRYINVGELKQNIFHKKYGFKNVFKHPAWVHPNRLLAARVKKHKKIKLFPASQPIFIVILESNTRDSLGCFEPSQFPV